MSVFIVFAVDAGDRLTLMTPTSPPEFKDVALSFVVSPKPARRTATGELGLDEPCAYDALECSRNFCIGKQVKFIEDYTIDGLQRPAGRVVTMSGESLSERLLQAGLATTPDRPHPKMSKELSSLFISLQNEAKAAKRGLHSPNAKLKVRKVSSVDHHDSGEVGKALMGKTDKVRLERALSGSVVIVYVPSIDKQLVLHMTGVSTSPAGGAKESMGSEAKFHTEKLLLHRNVTVEFEGNDFFGNIVGSIVSSKGSFQEELLRHGLARLQAATVGLSSRSEQLRAAERHAQEQKKGIWVDFIAAKITAGHVESGILEPGSTCQGGQGSRTFEGVVVQVLTGDTLFVRALQTPSLTKISLAGVRASKNITRDHDGKTPETRVTYRDYAWESKEHLRTHFIGRNVIVTVEYVREIAETKEQRLMTTVTDQSTGRNAAASVLEAGFAHFFLGKNDSCSCAEALQEAQSKARAQGLGVHSEKDAPVTNVVELSRLGESKGRYYLGFLQRGMVAGKPPALRGIVDVVLGGASYRIHIPREHFQIPFKLAGVIAPNALQSNEEGDPFAAESKDFAVVHLQQREVIIHVDTVDRGGNFIGSLQLVSPSNALNFAVQIVEAGLATAANHDRLSYGAQLDAAQAAAKAAKRYIWSEQGNLPSRHLRLEASRRATSSAITPADAEWVQARLVDVLDSTTVSLQRDDKESQALRQRMHAAIQAILADADTRGERSYAKGETVIVLYHEDGTWNRGKISHVAKEAQTAEVVFTDYGNRETVPFQDLRLVPKKTEYSLLKEAPSLLVTAKLAFLKVSKVSDDYIDAMIDEAWEYAGCHPQLFMKLLYTDSSNKQYYIVSQSPEDDATSLNDCLIRSGVAILDKCARAGATDRLYKKAEVAQEAARTARVHLWRYGDVDDGSEDEK
jgi:staphylococcal nuclease domain-containing protein 1